MPYQRDSEKKAAAEQEAMAMEQQQQQQQPQASQGPDLTKPQVQRGQMDLNKPNDPAEGFRMAQEEQRPGQAAALGPEQEATEQEQAEYERAMNALSKVIYEDDNSNAAIIRMLTPNEKVGSVAKASLLTLQQLDMKFDFDEVVIPELTKETVGRVIDLYQNVHNEEFTEQEVQGALGSTWEGVMEMYQVDEEDYAELTAGMTEDDFRNYEKQHKQFLGES